MIETHMVRFDKTASSKIVTAREAANLIKDGAVICCPLIGLSGWPHEIALAIRSHFEEEGHPKNITLVSGSAMGDHKNKGPTVLGREGLMARFIGSHTHGSPDIGRLIQEDKIAAYCFPQGIIIQLYREIAAKRAGMISKVGLGTFVDPRIEGGKMNRHTLSQPDLNEVITLGGEEYLWYKHFNLDVALIRGTTVDEKGNLTLENEAVHLEVLQVAQAVKNCGGIVIAQAQYLAQAGSLHPKVVKVPGVLVDYIVITQSPQENHMQTESVYFEPAFSGDVKIPLRALPELAFDERLFILRRASIELPPHAVVNLGIGIPDRLAIVAAKEGVTDMNLTTEIGGIGGVPAGWPNFGMTYNAECIVDHPNMFDWYDGGGIDIAFLGMGEVDKEGNVNVSKFSGRPIGCGGFINITQSSKEVIYCGTFTTGGLKVTADNGKLVILQEGKNKKFVHKVEQITFSGKQAAKVNKPVLYITERAVFSLIDGQMVLIEVAPGINLEKDILNNMEFTPSISPTLKTMSPDMFMPVWGRLAEVLEWKKMCI